MNTDEIVDKKTCYWPGPIGGQGPKGDQGLPGVNAVPADEAVATYIQTATSKTLNALNAWRPQLNAVNLGVDNTGATNVSDTIGQLCADTSRPGIYFPSGVYMLDKPVDTKIPVQAEIGAKFVAVNDMPYMFNVIGTFSASNPNNFVGLANGVFDGNGHAVTAITAHADNVLILSNLRVRGTTGIGVDLSDSHAPVVSNVYVDGVNQDITGIKASFDGQYTGIKIFRCTTGITTGVYNQFSDVYIWGGNHQTTHTIGIKFTQANSTALVHGIYFDGTQSCVYADADGCALVGDGVFVYANPNDTPTQDIMFADVPTTFNLDTRGLYIKPAKNISFSRDFLTLPFHATQESVLIDRITDPGHVFNDHNTEIAGRGYTISSNISIPPTYAVPILHVKASWVAAKFSVENLIGTFHFDLVTCLNSSIAINRILMKSSDGHDTYSFYADKTVDANNFRTIWMRNTAATQQTVSILVTLAPSSKDSYEISYPLIGQAPQPLPAETYLFA